MIKTIKQAVLNVGTLSTPEKMPCFSFSIPASKCITGGKLKSIVNSICSVCYAEKGNYRFPNVIKSLENRFAKLNHPLWVESMAFMINKREKSGFFRWHDSGDIQSVEHLSRIVAVCKLTPTIQHWLPTREYKIVSDWLEKFGKFPQNLTVRLSAYMLNGAPPIALAQRLGLTTSGVCETGFSCPSSQQDGKCLDCRACWNFNVATVNYKKH